MDIRRQPIEIHVRLKRIRASLTIVFMLKWVNEMNVTNILLKTITKSLAKTITKLLVKNGKSFMQVTREKGEYIIQKNICLILNSLRVRTFKNVGVTGAGTKWRGAHFF